MSSPIYVLYAPLGAFGNHVRWLCMLDDQYVVRFDDGTVLETVDQKLEYFAKNVYNDSRTFYNWLTYEWKWRNQLDAYLKVTHDMTHMFDGLKTIGLSMDPELAYKCYVKFNPSLNGITKEDFIKQVTKQNKMTNFAEQCIDTFRAVDSTKLFQPTLDIEVYTQILEYFNLESKYQEAQEIHTLWYNLHQKAEHEYLDYLNNPDPSIFNQSFKPAKRN